MNTIKFFKNFKDGKVFISGQNDKRVWFSLWKSVDFNNDLYLDSDLFKGGLEIDKSLLKLHDDEPGCRVLVFKNAEDELKFCCSKEQISEKKASRNSKGINKSYISLLFKELFANNESLQMGDGELAKILSLTEIEDEGLPF